jgi:hypothetical protein
MMKQTVRHEPYDTGTRRVYQKPSDAETRRRGDAVKKYARWYSEVKTLVFFPRVSVSPSHRVVVSHRPGR